MADDAEAPKDPPKPAGPRKKLADVTVDELLEPMWRMFEDPNVATSADGAVMLLKQKQLQIKGAYTSPIEEATPKEAVGEEEGDDVEVDARMKRLIQAFKSGDEQSA